METVTRSAKVSNFCKCHQLLVNSLRKIRKMPSLLHHDKREIFKLNVGLYYKRETFYIRCDCYNVMASGSLEVGLDFKHGEILPSPVFFFPTKTLFFTVFALALSNLYSS